MTRKRWVIVIALVIIILIIIGNIFYLWYVITPSFDSTSKKLDSIAVLPFTNLSVDKDQDYFCEGMTESIIKRLAKVEGLKVLSLNTVMQYKSKNVDIREIGKELNVSTILVGSLNKIGNRVRISAQLIDVKNGKHLWSQQYDREVNDVITFMDNLSQEITNTVTNVLSV